MTAARVRVRRDSYIDSVLLMGATRTMLGSPGVAWGSAVMGTPANIDALVSEGFERSVVEGAGANDLVLAVRAESEEAAEAALDSAFESLARPSAGGRGTAERRPGTLREALRGMDGANVAVISVPGPYAALEAHQALSAGLHVLLFSDNVTVEDEVALKERAAGLGLMLMGPGAGTAVLGGTGLGFANAVRPGPVGVVAAAGTGAQEVATLLHRWGAGVSHLIGVGGRDLSEAVGARMAARACRALEADPGTEAILLVSKPPAADVARGLLGSLGTKPVVACLVGFDEAPAVPEGVVLARTMEQACLLVLDILGLEAPQISAGGAESPEEAAARLDGSRGTVRGLFSGGTLCYESMVVMAGRLGPVHSNVPLRPEWALPAPPGSHVCLDLGEEEFTRGRPHPMIDPEPRAARIVEEGGADDVAVVLLDVVLGYGAHPDPASVLAPACAEAARRTGGPAVVAYVLGTDGDPQGYAGQVRRMTEAGCIVAPTAARAALAAAAIAARRPELASRVP